MAASTSLTGCAQEAKSIEIILDPVQNCTAARFYSVSFSKPNPVWFGKDTPKKLRRIFQTNSSLVWKEKMEFCKTQIPNQIQIGLEKIDDHCQPHENSKPNLVWFGKINHFCQRLEP